MLWKTLFSHNSKLKDWYLSINHRKKLKLRSWFWNLYVCITIEIQHTRKIWPNNLKKEVFYIPSESPFSTLLSGYIKLLICKALPPFFISDRFVIHTSTHCITWERKYDFMNNQMSICRTSQKTKPSIAQHHICRTFHQS